MPAHAERKPGLGSGIYTYADAARLLHVSAARIRGWADGYVRRVADEIRKTEPVLQRDTTETGLLTFCDLIELFVVKELIGAGVKLKEIRNAAKNLSQRFNTPYPFACSKLKTDGYQVLAEIDGLYENAAQQQLVFAFVEDFFRDIEFDHGTCLALEWWPMGRDKRIIVNPHRSFGSPVDKESGIRTDVIYATYKAEEDVALVADWYEISQEAVQDAVNFEEQWKRAA